MCTIILLKKYGVENKFGENVLLENEAQTSPKSI